MLDRQEPPRLAKPIQLRPIGRTRGAVLETLADAAFYLSATYNSAAMDDRAQVLSSRIRETMLAATPDSVAQVTGELERFLQDRRLI